MYHCAPGYRNIRRKSRDMPHSFIRQIRSSFISAYTCDFILDASEYIESSVSGYFTVTPLLLQANIYRESATAIFL